MVTDKGLQPLSLSLGIFKKNIADSELSEVVELVQDYSFNVTWEKPISFLFIDRLHDYINVSRDFNHFAQYIRLGAYIAFHNYADSSPGVITFVKELLDTGTYIETVRAKSLVVLQKKLPRTRKPSRNAPTQLCAMSAISGGWWMNSPPSRACRCR